MCLCELVACLSAVDRIEEAFAYSQVILRTFMYVTIKFMNIGRFEPIMKRPFFLNLYEQTFHLLKLKLSSLFSGPNAMF